MSIITFEAVFEDGVLRPINPLPLIAHQRVMVSVNVPTAATDWPEDTEAIYRELEEESLKLAHAMEQGIRRTWPREEDHP